MDGKSVGIIANQKLVIIGSGKSYKVKCLRFIAKKYHIEIVEEVEVIS